MFAILKVIRGGNGRYLKISKFSQILWIVNNVLKADLKDGFDYFSYAIILYGCEMWTQKQRDITRLKTAQMEVNET